METPKDKKDITKDNTATKKSTPRKKSTTLSKDKAIKSKAKSEIQKKAIATKKKTKEPLQKPLNRKPRIVNKPKDEKDIVIPPRKDVKGIPSAKLDVFKKSTTASSNSTNYKKGGPSSSKRKVSDHKTTSENHKNKVNPKIENDEATLKKITTKKSNVSHPSTNTKINNKQSVKVPVSKLAHKKQTTSKTIDTKSSMSTASKTKAKKKTVAKKKSKKSPVKKKPLKKRKVSIFPLIIIIIILLTFFLYKVVIRNSSLILFFGTQKSQMVQEDNIIEPKLSYNVKSDYIYIGDNIKDLDTLNKTVDKIDLSLLTGENSIINIEDASLSGDYIKLVIDKGLSASAIASLLEENNVCDRDLFLEYVIENNLETKLRSGSYLIKKDSSINEIVSSIVETDSTTITIYPASTIDQVDQLLTNRKLIESGEFVNSCTRLCKEKGLNFVEGWFTPATYKITNQFDVDLLAATMLENTFKILSPYLKDIAASGYSINDIIIIASLIQGETQDVDQMPLISSVIHNRLEKDIPLGIDATTRYELGDWTSELTQEVLDNQTPYNTRRKKGLPPGGICLSSKYAIVSAIYPLESDYLYYIHDKEGNIIPSLSYEEHLENIEKRDNKI